MTQRCPIDTLAFLLGERRKVYLSVRMGNNQKFTLSNATFSLECFGVIEDAGTCETEKQDDGSYILSVIIAPKQKKKYTLCFTYHLGEEIRKAEVTVNVS